MRVIVAADRDESAVRAADLVQAFLGSDPAPVLGLATGASVQPLHRELVRRHREEGLSFAATRAFLLDEYVGLEPDHPQMYRNVVRSELIGHIDLDPVRLHSPDVHAADLEQECARYDRSVRRAGIGLQILGIGRNGHLAFNEPGSPFDSRTRVVRLAASTRAHNAPFFDRPDQVPESAVTQGLGTILAARNLLVLASGVAKADAVRRALHGPVTDTMPASILQTHPRVTLLADPDALPSPPAQARSGRDPELRNGSTEPRRRGVTRTDDRAADIRNVAGVRDETCRSGPDVLRLDRVSAPQAVSLGKVPI